MNIKFNVSRGCCQKYTIDTVAGDSSVFIIDTDGLFVSIGSYGYYIYQWSTFNELNNFKQFLVDSDMGYIYQKICVNNRVKVNSKESEEVFFLEVYPQFIKILESELTRASNI